jgi:hypothetical protein
MPIAGPTARSPWAAGAHNGAVVCSRIHRKVSRIYFRAGAGFCFVWTGVDNGVGRHALETNRQGVFAIGDVRSGSVKLVAAAVGEGAQVVAALHVYLA